MTMDLSGIGSLIDGGVDDDLIEEENEYSALAQEAHRLRLENDWLRNALAIISAAIEALEKP
jgi:regulator of replication initiation timing